MAARTARLMGFTDGCEIKVIWNDLQVFDGIVSAAGTTDDIAVLAEWSTDTDIVGHIPLVIECTSGSLTFVNIHMNMLYPILQLELTSQPNWTIYTPTDQELISDYVSLTAEQLQIKYALTKKEIWQHLALVELQSIENHFDQPILTPDFAITDGKTSVTINGQSYARHDIDAYLGAWQWLIQEGQTFSCALQVDDFTQPPG